MANDNKSRNGGLGLLTTIFLIFMTLKLANVGSVAHWSWWWVTCPLWFIPALFIALWLLGQGLTKLGKYLEERQRFNRMKKLKRQGEKIQKAVDNGEAVSEDDFATLDRWNRVQDAWSRQSEILEHFKNKR